MIYEVQRHVVAELEALPVGDACPEAGGSSGVPGPAGSSGGSAERAAPAPSDAEYRLEVTPRTLVDLVASLCDERSRFVTPLGEDLVSASLGTKLSGSECYRRMVCLRFHIDYMSLPLGTQKLFAFTRAACQREQEQSEVAALLSANDLAVALQSASETHIWLQHLRTRPDARAASVDWGELAEQFVRWLQQAAQASGSLAQALRQLRLGQVVALAAWWAYLTCFKAAGIRRPSLMTTVVLEKKRYVPVEEVPAPATPYFRTVPLLGRPELTAPRICQLCGDGFVDWKALVSHCDREHGGFNEYRKRVFWEAQRCDTLGLPNVRKRNMIANATSAMLYARPGGDGELEERREVACVVCARKGWLEERHRCHLWKAFPDGDAGDFGEDEEEKAEGEASSEDEASRRQKRRALLRDADGVYNFGDAAKVNQILGVEHYAKAMPRIPLEELHASSAQHPRHPEYRWLLHTRRVPTELTASEPVDPSLPRCAGVGVEESTVWVCKQCRDSLCVRHSIGMPGPALANLMWAGREHPDFQDLSEATRTLLGRGRLVYQQVILKRGAPGEQPLGLAGNTIMLTQPKSSEIIQTLPPPREHLTDGFVVLFTTGRQDVKNAKMLEVPREQYLRCARVRAQVCEAFADVEVSETRAAETLPEQGVPDAFVEAALEVHEAEHFRARLP